MVNKNKSYWITPKNEVLDLDISYSESIKSYPIIFNLNESVSKDFEDKDKKSNILQKILENGYIHVSYIKHNDALLFSMNKLTESSKDQIEQFCGLVKGLKHFRGVTEVILLDIFGEKLLPKTFLNIDDVINHGLQYDTDKLLETIYNNKQYNSDILYLNKDNINEYNGRFFESGFGRISQIMRGQVPQIETFGIITAENPMGVSAGKDINKENNKKLETELREMGLGFHKISGKYGTDIENPFFIPNISKNELMGLGEKYKQDTVIFGEKQFDKEHGEFMFIQLIETHDDFKIQGTQTVFRVNPKDSEGKPSENFYSVYKGKKFRIPFFDDEFGGEDKHSFAKGYRGENISYDISIVPEEMKKSLNHINERIKKTVKTETSDRYRYETRGILKLFLKKLNGHTKK